MNRSLNIVECPRDAIQGLAYFVPTEVKIEYINLLLKVGFHTIDFGSFVSPKAIPQMADTEQVLNKLELGNTKTKLLAIVANRRGVEQAIQYRNIHYLGFPLSISETFQQRNTKSSIEAGLELVKETLEKCDIHQKELVVYLSMAFGNPYQDDYSIKMVSDYAGILSDLGCKIISLADTVGLANEFEIIALGETIIKQFPKLEIGMHLHANAPYANSKIVAALSSGCNRIDSALGGLGGCPYAEDALTGNLPTEVLHSICLKEGITTGIDTEKLEAAIQFLMNNVIQ